MVVPALPETYSGKYMRRMLRALLTSEPLGDSGALRNPECIEPLRAAVAGIAAPAPAQQVPMRAVQPLVLEAAAQGSGFSQPCSRVSDCPPLHVVVPRTAGSFDASAALAALVMKL